MLSPDTITNETVDRVSSAHPAQLAKIGTRIVLHGRSVIFRMAEFAVPRAANNFATQKAGAEIRGHWPAQISLDADGRRIDEPVGLATRSLWILQHCFWTRANLEL